MQTAQIPDCVMSVWKSISSVNSVESDLNQSVEACGSAIWKPKNFSIWPFWHSGNWIRYLWLMCFQIVQNWSRFMQQLQWHKQLIFHMLYDGLKDHLTCHWGSLCLKVELSRLIEYFTCFWALATGKKKHLHIICAFMLSVLIAILWAVNPLLDLLRQFWGGLKEVTHFL
jgi:hypothetical protein